MTMRPTVTDLPVELDEVSFAIRNVTILDRVAGMVGGRSGTLDQTA